MIIGYIQDMAVKQQSEPNVGIIPRSAIDSP
jgi:hypothetical protein